MLLTRFYDSEKLRIFYFGKLICTASFILLKSDRFITDIRKKCEDTIREKYLPYLVNKNRALHVNVILLIDLVTSTKITPDSQDITNIIFKAASKTHELTCTLILN